MSRAPTILDSPKNTTTVGFSAPFPSGYRASGVLLHLTSLPSRFGIGDLGPSAFAWVDQLADADQSWWQVLPLGPTGYNHSPYQALSSFAASTLIVSPDRLLAEDLLAEEDLEEISFAAASVDFSKVIPFKEQVLMRAWRRFRDGARADLRPELEQFRAEKGHWQEDVALFMSLRAKYRGIAFQQWPEGLVRREPSSLARAQRECREEIGRFLFGQFIVLRQWLTLKAYANERGIRLLGDLPIFVSQDSSDVWANPEFFLLDSECRPRVVAGVPPDYFSAEGQLWGNPLYNWDALRATGFRWWMDRLRARLEYLDAIRIDHFRGFEAAWHVPVEARTAQSGQWVPGPGADFFREAREALGHLPLLAEDLGVITPAVEALRDKFQLPGMRVLQFAFNGDPNNPHLPHRCVHNGVVYTGTHDNDTVRGWYDSALESERSHLWKCLQRSPGDASEVSWELIRLAWSSPAALAMTPLQDLLGLGSEARMNTPGRAEGQWRWRCSDADLSDEAVFQRLREFTNASGRAADRSFSANPISGVLS